MHQGAALSLLLFANAPTFTPQGKITAIEVRLFNPENGTFGANVLKDDAFVGWNTFLKWGNAGEGRGDAMVVVRLAATANECCEIHTPLTITARSNGKIIAQRRITRIDTRGGEVSRALFLENIGCAGTIIVEAQLQGQTKAASLQMGCGE